MSQKKLIITADDFGVFPAINKGVITAAEKGKINSVSVLTNFDHPTDPSLSFRQSVLDLTSKAPNTEIGCHLTITSGKPILTDKMNFLVDVNGNYKKFTEMPNFSKQEQLSALFDELCAQVQALKSVTGIQCLHLTNHHNSLTLYPHHFDVYLKVAKEFKIPMRSTNVIPERRQNNYLRFLKFALKNNTTKHDRQLISKFADEINDYFASHSAEVLAPKSLYSGHYGPISQAPTRILESAYVLTKQKKLKSIVENFQQSNDDSIEILVHLAQRDGFFVEKSKHINYTGIDKSYFDSRVAELRSILAFDLNSYNNTAFSSWTNL